MSEEKSNRPKDNRFFQQRLRAWRPILSLRDASIFFIISGALALIVGLVIFFTQNTIQEKIIPYTNCNNCEDTNSINCTCQMEVVLQELIPAPVYMFYGLNRFYQNHRQYMKSYDPNQLMGEKEEVSKDCGNFRNDSAGKIYAPCGIMANSLFNDTLDLKPVNNEKLIWVSENTALPSDKDKYAKITDWTNTTKPISWSKTAKERSSTAYKGDEELLVWMRPAPLPKFRKLYRILDTINSPKNYKNGLPAGKYQLNISYNYPVKIFGGEKYFVISNLSWLGGKNIVLSGLYLATGCLHIVIGLALLIIWLKERSNIPSANSIILQSKL